ncbi:unnamed protein product [Phytophthora lilii]|uniref:Unnamed protein product n=1 Tax=Phytophthora lilii TaxID=2077276 RepID=A0A9W6TJY6_9STRA|nr:unnamed protein product [Phytophthora lilii]
MHTASASHSTLENIREMSNINSVTKQYCLNGEYSLHTYPTVVRYRPPDPRSPSTTVVESPRCERARPATCWFDTVTSPTKQDGAEASGNVSAQLNRSRSFFASNTASPAWRMEDKFAGAAH